MYACVTHMYACNTNSHTHSPHSFACDGAQNDLGISEAMLTGESVIKRKGVFNIQSHDGSEEPLKVCPALYSGTFVQEGEGRMIVLAVGKNTYQGLMEAKMNEDEQEKSVLQSKLDDMTDLITVSCMWSCYRSLPL
jgi:magnesium-transporting ATPase (P-type)